MAALAPPRAVLGTKVVLEYGKGLPQWTPAEHGRPSSEVWSLLGSSGPALARDGLALGCFGTVTDLPARPRQSGCHWDLQP